MITEAEIPEAIDRMDSEGMLAIGREFGMAPPTEAELPEARDLAQKLMDHKVVGIETLVAVLAIQPASSLVYKEDGRITGVSGQLMLTPEAFRVMLAGQFDATDVDTRLLARDGDLVLSATAGASRRRPSLRPTPSPGWGGRCGCGSTPTSPASPAPSLRSAGTSR